jgi:hypothetical protein
VLTVNDHSHTEDTEAKGRSHRSAAYFRNCAPWQQPLKPVLKIGFPEFQTLQCDFDVGGRSLTYHVAVEAYHPISVRSVERVIRDYGLQKRNRPLPGWRRRARPRCAELLADNTLSRLAYAETIPPVETRPTDLLSSLQWNNLSGAPDDRN